MDDPVRILVLEDEPLDYELIERSLHRGGLKYSAQRVDTERDFLASLKRDRPDVILSDHALPQFDGMTALKCVRRLAPEIPFIFVAGALGEELVIEAFELGAADYVLKHRLADLAPTIKRAIEVKKRAREVSWPSPPGADQSALFKCAVDQTKEAVVITTARLASPGPQILYVNRAFTLMTGYAAEEAIGKTPRMLQGKKTNRKVLDRLKEQLQRGETFEGETFNYRKDGSEYILQWEISPIRNSSGEITHFVSVQRDVTERRRAEATRIEQERAQAQSAVGEATAMQMSELLARVTDAFVSLDRNWNYTFVNQKAGELFGRKPEDLTGKHIWTEFPAGRDQPFRHAYEKAFREQKPMQIEAFYEPWQKWFENRIYPSPEGLTIFFQDVTEEKRTREELKASVERFDLAMRVAQDVLYDWDVQNHRVRWNQNYYSIFRYSSQTPREDLQLWIDRLHPEDRGRVFSTLSAAILGNASYWEAEYRFKRGDGSYADVYDRGYIMRDAAGVALRMVGAIMDISRQKRHAESLHETNRRISAILESITDAFFLLDRDWRFTYVNRQAEILFRRPREDLLGRNVWAEFPEAVGSQFEEAYRRAILERVTVKFEAFYAPLDAWLFVTAYPSPDGLSVYFHDITDRKRAEESLRESEEFNRKIIASSSDCIKILDVEGKLLSMTEGGQKLMEILNLEPYLGSFWVDFWRNDNSKDAQQALAQAREGGVGRFQGYCPTMAGTPKYWDVICTPILGPEGKPEKILSVARDITELKNAEEQRRAMQARKEAIVTSALDAIITIDQESNIQDWNPAAENIFGYKREEAIGQDMANLIIPPDLRQHHKDGLSHYLKTGHGMLLGRRYELPALRADGSTFPAEISISRIPIEGAPLFTGFVRDITERKQAEKKLRDREERLRLILDNAQDYAIFTIDLQGRVTSWNSGAEKIFLFTREKIIGQSGSVIFTPEDREKGADQAELQATLTRGLAQDERWHLRKNGERFWANGLMRALKDDKGTVRGFLKILRDDTARRQMENELRDRVRQQEAVAELGRIALVTADLQAVFQSATQVIGQNLAVPLCSIAEFVPQENRFILRASKGGDPSEIGQPIEAAEESLAGFTLSTSQPVLVDDVRAETRFTPSASLQKYGVISAVSVVIHGRESVFGVLGAYSRERRAFSAQDITFVQSVANILSDAVERKRNEEQIQSSEERFRLIIENAKDYAIYMLDQEGKVASWNIGAERIEGYQAEEILDQNFSIFFTDQDRRKGKPLEVLRVARQEGRFEEENWFVRKDKKKFWANVTVTAISDETGHLCGFSKILRDMSPYKKAREEVERLNADLERRVRRRTAELLAANQELEAFNYSVSHDLTAPLRHIKAFVEMLKDTVTPKLDQEENRYLQTIDTAAQKMTKLIEDLLSFSRIMRTELVLTTFPLRPVVDEVIESLEIETARRQVQWTIGELPMVRGDPNTLRQVVYNLLSNALKYTRPRAVAQIEVGARTDDKEHVIFVRDNGVGFDLKYADKLFGVFQRLHPESKFEGTGIGLANVRRIVERHGGKVWAESQVDQGATFAFSLPKT